MEKQARKRSNNWVITVESRNDNTGNHLQQSPSVPTAFRTVWVAHGFDLDDWIMLKRTSQNDFNGNTSNLICYRVSARSEGDHGS